MSAGSAARAEPARIDMSISAHWTVGLNVEAYASLEPNIGRFLSREGVKGSAAYVSQLVVEEIVRNLIEHTPPYAQDETASVTITVTTHHVTVVIEDQRMPFDPAGAPHLDIDAPLDARRPGGMGLHLVRNMTDDLTYEIGHDRNRLTAVISRP